MAKSQADTQLAALKHDVDQLWKRMIMAELNRVNVHLAVIRSLLDDVPAQTGVPLDQAVRLEQP